MSEENGKINCSTFQKQEAAMYSIKHKINAASDVREKAEFALELQKEADVVLSCPDHTEDRLDCKNCRLIANLNKKTAEIIIKATKLT